MINHPDENHDTAEEYRAGRPAEEEDETGVPPDVAAMVGVSPKERGEAMSVGELIRQKRTEAKLGVRELARQAEIAPSYLCDIESGARRPAENVIYDLADVLGINREEACAVAGVLGPSVEAYLMIQPEAVRLFRRIAQANLNTNQLQELQKQCNTIVAVRDLRAELRSKE